MTFSQDNLDIKDNEVGLRILFATPPVCSCGASKSDAAAGRNSSRICAQQLIDSFCFF
jgi:hypothetical protein